MKRIAVVGATGETGSATIRELLLLGERPLCVVRDRVKARHVLGTDSDVAVADIESRVDLEKAFKGVDRLLFVTGRSPNLGAQQINIVKAAQEAGVEFILKVSGARGIVGPDSGVILGRDHHSVEQVLKEAGIAWCILRPGLFMQNTLDQADSIKVHGELVLPFGGDLKLSFIDVRDTAAMAARILRDPQPHIGRTIEFTGLQTTYDEFANVFSDILEKTVSCVTVSLETAEAGMKSKRVPEWLIDHTLSIARIIANGGFTPEQTQPIKKILGRAPITTRQFVQDYKTAFC